MSLLDKFGAYAELRDELLRHGTLPFDAGVPVTAAIPVPQAPEPEPEAEPDTEADEPAQAAAEPPGVEGTVMMPIRWIASCLDSGPCGSGWSRRSSSRSG